MARITFDGRSADDALSPFDAAKDLLRHPRDHAGHRRAGTCASPRCSTCCSNSPEKLSTEVRALLATALHQVEYSRNPLHVHGRCGGRCGSRAASRSVPLAS